MHNELMPQRKDYEHLIKAALVQGGFFTFGRLDICQRYVMPTREHYFSVILVLPAACAPLI
jgi:hypothetical protein